MVRKTNKGHWVFAFAILLTFCGSLPAQQDQYGGDPPSRVARLNYFNGNVSMQPAGVDEWTPAELNRPFTIGDYLYTDQSAEAELHMDVAVMRMGAQTSFGFLNLDDRTVQLKLTEGDMYIRVRNFGGDQVFEVDTPNAAVNLQGNGVYRFRVDPNGNMTFVVVRQGQAQITGGGQSFLLDAGSSATLSGTEQLAYDIEEAPAPDQFDNWSQSRDAHEARLTSARYVSSDVVGYEDLDDNGSWQQTAEYGPVWYPQSVDPGWAPYQSGHWAWIAPWGWTWVDNMRWGFAPFHYGRWAYVGNRWGWCPGPLSSGYGRPSRSFYAPALVAWFGGIGVAIGGGSSLGWVPLGYGELYTPSYRCSPRYFNNVNVYNTRVVNNVNITNVYNNVYVNHQTYNQQFVNVRAPNAVMSMPQNAFASGRTVRQAGAVVSQANFARIKAAPVVAPPVAPTQQSVLATAGAGRPVARPIPQVAQRTVVARNTPPPAPANFASHQQYLQQHVGQPVNFAAMRQATSPTPAVAANVRPVAAPTAAIRPVVARPGQRVGTPAVASGPAGRPGQPTATPQQPGRTGQPVQAQQQPGRPGQQPVQQGYPTNRAGQPQVVNGRTVPPPAPPQTYRPGAAAPPAQTQPNQPAPAAHGLPPNMRQNGQPAAPANSAERTQQPANGGYPRNNAPSSNERTQPGYRTEPQYNSAPARAQQPAPNQQIQERTQPAPTQQPQYRTQPAPTTASPARNEERGVPPNQQPQYRAQPSPERSQTPERSQPTVRNEERSQPPAPPQRPVERPVEQRPTAEPRPQNERPAAPQAAAAQAERENREARPSNDRPREEPKSQPKDDKKPNK